MRGFTVCYQNITPEIEGNKDAIFQFVKTYNKDLLTKLVGCGYEMMFVPTYNEASRIEKVDMDTTPNKTTNPMKGFVVYYMNITPAMDSRKEELLQFIKTSNKDLFAKFLADGYEAMYVITYNEATRIDLIDLDKITNKGTNHD